MVTGADSRERKRLRSACCVVASEERSFPAPLPDQVARTIFNRQAKRQWALKAGVPDVLHDDRREPLSLDDFD
jgi:hypothetical protein